MAVRKKYVRTEDGFDQFYNPKTKQYNWKKAIVGRKIKKRRSG